MWVFLFSPRIFPLAPHALPTVLYLLASEVGGKVEKCVSSPGLGFCKPKPCGNTEPLEPQEGDGEKHGVVRMHHLRREIGSPSPMK